MMDQGNNISNLPEDILVNIFHKLPPDSVAVCRAVCWQWHLLTSIPYFYELLDRRRAMLNNVNVELGLSTLQAISNFILDKKESLKRQADKIAHSNSPSFLYLVLYVMIYFVVANQRGLSCDTKTFIYVLLFSFPVVGHIVIIFFLLLNVCNEIKKIENKEKNLIKGILELERPAKLQKLPYMDKMKLMVDRHTSREKHHFLAVFCFRNGLLILCTCLSGGVGFSLLCGRGYG